MWSSYSETDQGLDLGPLNPEHKIQCPLAASIRRERREKSWNYASWVADTAGMQREDTHRKEGAYYKD